MKAKDLYDIAIIGTGPAGATLARLLHPKYKIIAIEKRTPMEMAFRSPAAVSSAQMHRRHWQALT